MRSKIQDNGMSLGSQQGVTTELSELDHASSGFEIQGHPIGQLCRYQRFAVHGI